MKAGLLNKVIDIYSCTVSSNDFGHIETTYNKTYTTRANVKYNSGNRQFENDEVVFTTDITFTIRKYVPIELVSRIKYNGNYYRVLSIEESDQLNNKTVITELVNE